MRQPVLAVQTRCKGIVHAVRVCHFFLIVYCLCAAFPTASVQARSWIPVGAPGGNVRDLAQDPRNENRIYLGTADGILYRSDDGGVRWHRLTPGFPLRGFSLDNIVVDSRGVVYVGYWEVHGPGGGVARSTDRGQTFTLLDGMVKNESVRALAVAPSDERVVAAGTLSGVFLSRDGGQTWSRITPKGHPDLRNVESLAFDPRDNHVLYAGTWHLVWKTGDAGKTWEPAHRGMIDDSDVMTLTIDHVRAQTIYATACSGIYRSTKGADEWTKLRGIPFSSRRTRAFAQGVDDLNLLLAGTTEGLWVSDTGGDSWERVTPKELVVNAVLSQPGGTILLGTEEAGVLRSDDRGRTWASSNTGFSERFVFKMLFDERGRRVIVAIWGAPRFGGVFVAPSVAGPWTRLGQGLDGRQVLSLALEGDAILAGTDDGIFVRTSGAKAWSRLPTRVEGRETNPRVTELLVLPSGALLAATPKGVMRSVDDGTTWTKPTLGRAPEVFDLALAPKDPLLVVAATRSGFFRSADGGKTWEQLSSTLGVTWNALAFAPGSDRVLYATSSGGLLRSGDQGVTWRRVEGGLPHSDLTGIAISPDGQSLYVSDFTWGGIFRSADAGRTWNRMPTDGLGSDRVWTLSVDPDEPDRVLAAPSAGGLHMMVASPASSSR